MNKDTLVSWEFVELKSVCCGFSERWVKGKPSLSLSEWPHHTSLAPVTCSHHSSRLIRHIPNTNFCHRVSCTKKRRWSQWLQAGVTVKAWSSSPLSHWRCFQCDLCGETFEPEDDPKNQRRAQHQNQCLVVIELSHQPLHWNATSLVFYPLLLLFWVGKYNEPPWNRNCHPCDPLINQQWLLAPQGL